MDEIQARQALSLPRVLFVKRFLLLVLLLALGVLLVPNVRSLYEGIVFYLFPALTYRPTPVQPVNPAGRYASLYDLVRLPNQKRFEYIRDHLALPGVTVTLIPIPNSPFSDVFATFQATGPYLVFCAHYDKFSDDPNFQGADDNTSGVSILLASIATFAQRGNGGNRAFLFTGEEETGLHGAAAFVDFVRAHQLAIKEIVDYNSFGRDQLAIRPPAALPGFVFTLPFYGDVTYDGQNFRRGPAFPPPDAPLAQAIQQIEPQTVVLQRFTSLSDSNVFQADGIKTVAVSSSNMYYLQLAWNTFADRVELIDERNLDLAYDLVMRYPGTRPDP